MSDMIAYALFVLAAWYALLVIVAATNRKRLPRIPHARVLR